MISSSDPAASELSSPRKNPNEGILKRMQKINEWIQPARSDATRVAKKKGNMERA